jgi:hypothetical protein
VNLRKEQYDKCSKTESSDPALPLPQITIGFTIVFTVDLTKKHIISLSLLLPC